MSRFVSFAHGATGKWIQNTKMPVTSTGNRAHYFVPGCVDGIIRPNGRRGKNNEDNAGFGAGEERRR